MEFVQKWGFAVLAALFLVIFVFNGRRIFFGSKYKWIQFLSEDDWKTPLMILLEVRKEYKTSWFWSAAIHQDLRELEEEGVIEGKIDEINNCIFFSYRRKKNNV